MLTDDGARTCVLGLPYFPICPCGFLLLPADAFLSCKTDFVISLADACGDALSSWGSVQAADGSTAADFAARTGAQDINAMIQRKLNGQPSGLEVETYQFDPETGELIDTDAAEAQTSPQAASSSKSKGDQIMATQPELRSKVDQHALKGVIKTHRAPAENHPQYSSNGSGSTIVESLEEDRSSPCSNGYEPPSFAKHVADEAFYEEVPADATLEGTQHKRTFSDDQMCLEQKVCNLKDLPRVFDLHAAMLSSAVVGAVGVAALGLRFCLEYFGV